MSADAFVVLEALDLSVAGDVRDYLNDEMLDGDRPDEKFRLAGTRVAE
jgi:hypothetical protein